MRQLEETVRKNRFNYKLVERYTDQNTNKSCAIYSQHDDNGSIIAYEVFIIPIRKKDMKTPSGIVVPAGEVFPGNEYFGVGAWTVGSEEKARERFEKLKIRISE